ncbi:MAG: MinD/ParA family protein [Alphaproteobacteria bacterium]|nr:MAG: MinD/ParA family protein [Alphaproteobacteria bacterium]
MNNPTPRTISIASGKGGVGKTWFSITLAHALARQGRRVLLIDGDLGLANVDVQLGLLPSADLGAVIAGSMRLADIVSPYEPGGFEVIAGRSGCGDLSNLSEAQLQALMTQLDTLLPDRDHILLDLGAGVGGSVRHMAAWADMLFVIATEEPTSLTDAYATLKLHSLDKPGGDARLVINQAESYRGGDQTADTLTRACVSFLGRAPNVAGTIRRDPNVSDAIRRQTLMLQRHPNSPAAVDLERIAVSL